MPEFKIPIMRIGYAVCDITVDAANQEEAERIALDRAGSHVFREHDADYMRVAHLGIGMEHCRQSNASLTAAQQRQYLACRGSKCPFCGSGDIEGTGRSNSDADWHENEVECQTCGAVWLDIYTLSGVQGVSC